MILNYFGINKLPDGKILDPGTLNVWLKNNHGYIDGIHSGYVNPLAISSLSKKAAKINKITAFDALEYSRIQTSDKLILANQISVGIPAILEEPGHYIVAKGINGNTFTINDPYYINRTDLTAYNNTFNSISELTPANSDLSYIMVTGNENLNFQFKDSNGQNTGEQFNQQSLINPGNNESAGEPLKIAYIQKPQTGNYQIEIGANKSSVYDVEVYSYDKDGNVEVENIPVVTHADKTNIINLIFNSQNVHKFKLSKVVSFDSLIDDINNLKSLNLIKDKAYKTILETIQRIEKHYAKTLGFVSKFELELLRKSLVFYNKSELTHQAYQVISEDIKDLTKSL